MEGSSLQLENRTQVIIWLRENYKHATTTSVSKRSVFGHYLEACKKQGVLTPISHTYFGKLVRKAFPDVRCNRKGPRGSAQQHYRLTRVDGLETNLSDAEDDLGVSEAAPVTTKRNIAKRAVSATAVRKPLGSRVRAAATAAASNISRMISADHSATHLTEAWSFSSAPSSPVDSGSQSCLTSAPSSPAQSSGSEDDYEEVLEESSLRTDDVEEEEEEAEYAEAFEEDGAEAVYGGAEEPIHLELPQFDFVPGEESPCASFSYPSSSAAPMSGHQQNLLFQQQLQHSFSDHQQQQQQQADDFFDLSFLEHEFVSPDLPLSALNQVNYAEDFGWSVPSMPSTGTAMYCNQAQHQSFHRPQQQATSFMLSDQLPATHSDLFEWVELNC